MCDKGFIWNPSNCECECDKLCDVGKYLDYENCKCRKNLVDKSVEVKITQNENENTHKWNSCTLCIVLFSIQLTLEFVLILFIFIGTWMLLPLKQQSTKLINGRSQTNWDQKSNLLLLQRHYQSQKFRVKLLTKTVNNWQKVVQKHWCLLH